MTGKSANADGPQPASFLRRWRNTIFSTADHFWLLLLWAVSTPIFIHTLGEEAFGVWVLVNAVIGMGGVVSFGFGEATVRYVALYRGQRRPAEIRRIVDTTLGLYLMVGAVVAVLLAIAAPAISRGVFGLEGADAAAAQTALKIAGLSMAVTSALKTYEAVINGFERYDVTARVGMVARSIIILGNVALALMGFGLVALIACALIGLTMQAAALFFIARRWFAPWLRPVSLPDWRTTTEISGYGLQSWLQISAGALNSIADRFLVAALLGPAAAGVYTICVQLAQQIHLLLSRGLAFLMPVTSRTREAGGSPDAIFQAYKSGATLSLVVAGAIGLPLYVLASQVLTVWVGESFAREGAAALRVLAIYYIMFGAAVPPYFLLNGAGLPGWNTIVSLVHALLGLTIAAILATRIGLEGVALGRLAALVVFLLLFRALQRHLLPMRSATVFNIVFLSWCALIAAVAIGLGGFISPAIQPAPLATVSAGVALSIFGAVLGLVPWASMKWVWRDAPASG